MMAKEWCYYCMYECRHVEETLYMWGGWQKNNNMWFFFILLSRSTDMSCCPLFVIYVSDMHTKKKYIGPHYSIFELTKKDTIREFAMRVVIMHHLLDSQVNFIDALRWAHFRTFRATINHKLEFFIFIFIFPKNKLEYYYYHSRIVMESSVDGQPFPCIIHYTCIDCGSNLVNKVFEIGMETLVKEICQDKGIQSGKKFSITCAWLFFKNLKYNIRRALDIRFHKDKIYDDMYSICG